MTTLCDCLLSDSSPAEQDTPPPKVGGKANFRSFGNRVLRWVLTCITRCHPLNSGSPTRCATRAEKSITSPVHGAWVKVSRSFLYIIVYAIFIWPRSIWPVLGEFPRVSMVQLVNWIEAVLSRYSAIELYGMCMIINATNR
ncbi:hypothetical protein B0O80DRAFT_423163 [Mortierella sp. GBAus27b]|nr:hypothetical protein B0O80DRAFT_423163 [Mortierella sp. GBAus27b]